MVWDPAGRGAYYQEEATVAEDWVSEGLDAS